MKHVCAALVLMLAVAAAAGQAPAPDVVVYYFHGDIRCSTCLMLEDLTVRAVRDSFPAQLVNKSLDLQVVNFMSEGDEHFADDFVLEFQSVIVAEFDAGKIVRWKNLERIWDLHDQPARFAAYIAGETRLYLDGVPDSRP